MGKKQKTVANKKATKISCIDCRYFVWDDDKNICHCSKHNIDIKILKNTETEFILDRDVCDDYKEARYIITEKGILSLVLTKLEIESSVISEKIDTVWDIFFENMKKYGFFIENEDGDKKEYPKTEKTPEDFMKSAIIAVYKINNEDILDAVWLLFMKGMKESGYIK